LIVRSDAMQNHRVPAGSIYQQEIRAEMTLGQASPVRTPLVETMLAECLGQRLTRDHGVEDVLKSRGIELRMLACRSVVAPEARQDD
jgi:hypothetical protein